MSSRALDLARRLRENAPMDQPKRPYGAARYVGADWTKGDTELAQELGVTRPAIAYARGVHGFPSTAPRRTGWKRPDARLNLSKAVAAAKKSP